MMVWDSAATILGLQFIGIIDPSAAQCDTHLTVWTWRACLLDAPPYGSKECR
jgi:hypothetical protein